MKRLIIADSLPLCRPCAFALDDRRRRRGRWCGLTGQPAAAAVRRGGGAGARRRPGLPRSGIARDALPAGPPPQRSPAPAAATQPPCAAPARRPVRAVLPAIRPERNLFGHTAAAGAPDPDARAPRRAYAALPATRRRHREPR